MSTTRTPASLPTAPEVPSDILQTDTSAFVDRQGLDKQGVDKVDKDARRLVADLHTPSPAIYWLDLFLSAAIGWGSFAIALASKSFSGTMFVALIISVFALYRGLCFLHELSHLRQSALRGFETTWNVLFGVPLVMPSLLYLGVHQSHHKLSTYGTKQDPEYLPFSGRPLMIAVFSLESLLLPAMLMIRFVLLAPFSLMLPRLHSWLLTHASSFCMNVHYRREATESVSRKIARWEAVILGVWGAVFTLGALHILPWRFFAIWYAVMAFVSFINTIRTLGAHRYGSDGQPLDREGQLIDSIDTPGAFWTELWAPVGLRYHALHHYFPGIPYHNLRSAHRRLIQVLPKDSQYSQATSPGLPNSLQSLWRGTKS